MGRAGDIIGKGGGGTIIGERFSGFSMAVELVKVF